MVAEPMDGNFYVFTKKLGDLTSGETSCRQDHCHVVGGGGCSAYPNYEPKRAREVARTAECVALWMQQTHDAAGQTHDDLHLSA
jgi:hypothetical protein